MMELFEKIVEGFESLIIFVKHSILDVWQGSEKPLLLMLISAWGKI